MVGVVRNVVGRRKERKVTEKSEKKRKKEELMDLVCRLSKFRQQYPMEEGWDISTQCILLTNDDIIFKAIIKDPQGRIVATAHSPCEDRAIDRVLTVAGIEL